MMKRLIPTILTGFTMTLLPAAGAEAAPITGPGGQIVSATTTATLINNAGGCTGPGAANCTIDGLINSAAGTFVEWLNVTIPQTEIFSYTLNQPYDVTRFLLWNDRGAPDSGIANFDLIFKDPSGVTVGAFNGNGLPNRGNNPTPEVFNVGLRTNVKTIDLRINSTHDLPPAGVTQFREVEFDGTPVPEPASLALLSLGSLMVLKRRMEAPLIS